MPLFFSFDDLLKSKSDKSAILLFGDDTFRLNQELNLLIKYYENQKYELNRIDSEDNDELYLVNSASTVSFFAEKRLLIVKNLHRLLKTKTSSKKSISPLENYLNNPNSDSIIIATAEDASLNQFTQKGKKKQDAKVKAPYDLIINNFSAIAYPVLDQAGKFKFVKETFEKAGKKVKDEAVNQLIEYSLDSSGSLSNEVEKIITTYFDKLEITSEDIISLITSSKEYNIFELQKQIGLKNTTKSFEILENMIKTNSQEIFIIATLSRFFINLLKISDCKTKGLYGFELSRATGVFGTNLTDYENALRKFSTRQIEDIVLELCYVDEMLKSTSVNSKILLQQLFVKIFYS